MRARALEFRGCCNGCSQGNDTPSRGGVLVDLDRDDVSSGGEMFCLRCAKRLAQKILTAIAECKEKRSAGLEYRYDRWRKPLVRKAS